MSKMKDHFAEMMADTKFLDGYELNNNPIQEWTDDELEPLRSDCCDAPVSIIETHYICTKCKRES